MKKTRAMKVLAVVLAMAMVLGTSLSAMAATVTSTTTVKDGVTKVTTNVSGLSGSEMATYLVTGADSLYQVDSTNIKYIDQKDAAAGAVRFEYTGGALTANDKIYVGAESLSTPIKSEDPTEISGAIVYENGIQNALNSNLTNTEGTKKDIQLAGSAANVTSVYKNGTEVPFAKKADGIAVFCALDDGDVLSIYYTSTVVSAASIINSGNYNATYPAAKNKTGSICTLNRYESMADSEKNPQGEAAPGEYWFVADPIQGEFTFSYGRENVAANIKNNKYAETELATNYPEIYALYKDESSTASTWSKTLTIDEAGTPNVGGLVLDNNTWLEQEFSVAEDGNYELIARTASWAASRKPTFEIYQGDTKVADAVITPTQISGKWNFAAADGGAVALKGGVTYTLKAKSSEKFIRFDFAAFIPAGEPADAALAGQDAFMAEIAKSDVAENVEVRIGDVKLTDTALTVLARVFGNYTDCGIAVGSDKYAAIGVAGNGAYAVELQDDAGMIEAFQNAAVKAYVNDGFDDLFAGPVTPTVIK